MLFGFLPVNVYSAIQRVPFGGHEVGPAYLLIRVPFQLLLIWWAAKATGVLLRPGRAAAEELASRSQ
jgi:uncharacterized membrane protein